MEKDIWTECDGSKHFISLNTSAWRIVEAQNIIATRKLVDSLEEQDILEELIDANKPKIAKDLLNSHYLLYTPFRYPPLKHGSRFGTRLEPSLWYGSLELDTVMAELAYYRFNFLRASKKDLGNVIVSLTAFSVPVKTQRSLDLRQAPFSEFSPIISSPVSYEASQRLGSAMRKNQVESFFYHSARDPHKGDNLALFTPQTFSQKTPHQGSFQSWQCIVNLKLAEFVRLSAIKEESRSFPIEVFLVDGVLPFPAY